MMFLSSGRAAELGGFLFTAVDRYIYGNRLRQTADAFYAQQDPESVIALEFFAQGFSDYAAQYPDEFTGPFSAILPVSGIDVFRANIRVLYSFTFAGSGSFSLEFAKTYGENPFKGNRKDGEHVTYAVDDDLDPLSVPSAFLIVFLLLLSFLFKQNLHC